MPDGGRIGATDMPFPFGRFHTGGEVEAGLSEAALSPKAIHGVEGPAGVQLEFLPPDHPSIETKPELAREWSLHPGLREMGPHLVVARHPGMWTPYRTTARRARPDAHGQALSARQPGPGIGRWNDQPPTKGPQCRPRDLPPPTFRAPLPARSAGAHECNSTG